MSFYFILNPTLEGSELHIQAKCKNFQMTTDLKTLLTNAIGDFDGFGLAEHGHTTVTLLLIRHSPVLVRVLGHRGDISREGFLSTLCLLQAQNIWILLAHPLEERPQALKPDSTWQIISVAFTPCTLTSRPFFFTHALRPSTFHEVIFMLASRPSLLVILSGGSSYIIGASGSLAFFVFFAEAEVKRTSRVMKVVSM